MLQVENISTGYGKKQILYNVSFAVEKGDFVLLTGLNGSGKSTLLKAIFRLCKVWQGKIVFENEVITDIDTNELLKKGILYVPQKNNVFEQLTVQENLEISGMALNNKLLFKDRLAQVQRLFPTLVSNYKKHPMKMSGGERQQLVLAMTMLHQPKLLLIDEPFTGLAPQAIQNIQEQLHTINKLLGVTVVMVEHCIKEAIPLANCLIALKLGTIVECTRKMNKFTPDYLNQILI